MGDYSAWGDDRDELETPDWYEKQNELEPGMVFTSCYGVVRLDHRVPGDGTDWSCDVWISGRPNVPGYEKGHWSAEELRIHPSDLEERLPDDYSGPLQP